MLLVLQEQNSGELNHDRRAVSLAAEIDADSGTETREIESTPSVIPDEPVEASRRRRDSRRDGSFKRCRGDREGAPFMSPAGPTAARPVFVGTRVRIGRNGSVRRLGLN